MAPLLRVPVALQPQEQPQQQASRGQGCLWLAAVMMAKLPGQRPQLPVLRPPPVVALQVLCRCHLG